jgi:hypothetical protein
MGLISIGADGTITVDWDAVSAADDGMKDLIEKLDTFIDLIADVLGIEIDSEDATLAEGNVSDAAASVRDLQGLPTTELDIETNDEGAIARAGIKAEIFAMDLLSATLSVYSDTDPFWDGVNGIPTDVGDRYIDVWFRQRNDPGGGAFAQGGMTTQPGYSLVGENGPEVVSLPTGAMINPAHATKSRGRGLHNRDSGGDLIVENITLVAQSPAQLASQLRSFKRREDRQ